MLTPTRRYYKSLILSTVAFKNIAGNGTTHDGYPPMTGIHHRAKEKCEMGEGRVLDRKSTARVTDTSDDLHRGRLVRLYVRCQKSIKPRIDARKVSLAASSRASPRTDPISSEGAPFSLPDAAVSSGSERSNMD